MPLFTNMGPKMDNMSHAEEFYQTIDKLVELHLELRKSHIRQRDDLILPDIRFAMDCQTVKVSVGRKGGHTSYICNRMTHRSLVVVRFPHLKRYYLSGICPVLTWEDIYHSGRANGLKPDTVFIDDASSFNRSELHDIYWRVLRDKGVTFILLG